MGDEAAERWRSESKKMARKEEGARGEVRIVLGDVSPAEVQIR